PICLVLISAANRYRASVSSPQFLANPVQRNAETPSCQPTDTRPHRNSDRDAERTRVGLKDALFQFNSTRSTACRRELTKRSPTQFLIGVFYTNSRRRPCIYDGSIRPPS